MLAVTVPNRLSHCCKSKVKGPQSDLLDPIRFESFFMKLLVELLRIIGGRGGAIKSFEAIVLVFPV